jgi:hypothetical protein
VHLNGIASTATSRLKIDKINCTKRENNFFWFALVGIPTVLDQRCDWDIHRPMAAFRFPFGQATALLTTLLHHPLRPYVMHRKGHRLGRAFFCKRSGDSHLRGVVLREGTIFTAKDEP